MDEPKKSTWFLEARARSNLQPLPPCRLCGFDIDEESLTNGPATEEHTGLIYHARCLQHMRDITHSLRNTIAGDDR